MEIFPKLGHFVVKDDDDVDDDMGCSSQPQGICPLLVSDPGIISLPTERGSSKKLDDDHDYDDDLYLQNKERRESNLSSLFQNVVLSISSSLESLISIFSPNSFKRF